MRNMQEVIQLESTDNETALEASENKMFTLAALLKTIGTVCAVHCIVNLAQRSKDCHCHGWIFRDYLSIAANLNPYHPNNSSTFCYR
jgi:hypothetical protein